MDAVDPPDVRRGGSDATVRMVGAGNHPVLIIDDFCGAIDQVVATAAGLGAFPPAEGNAYPGVRRFITPRDTDAVAYARRTLQTVVPYVNAAFGVTGFDLLEASFSLVTTAPDRLSPMQRAPHFDSVDPDYLAVLHYIGGVAGSGTAFYRQRSTGIERVTAGNNAGFVEAAKREAVADTAGYIRASNAWFDRIGLVEAQPDRLIVYRGSLLHSGMIPPDMPFSDDPRTGRLTANFFVRGRRA
jgi:hypothetical protein